MGRTLYLNESSGAVIKRDGPSLWVTYPNKSGQRIPVLDISKVVIIGNVKMDAGSITLFSCRNIPVVFMDNNGFNNAITLPYNHKISKHHKEQRIFYENSNNAYRYYNWAKSKRSLIQTNMLKRLFKRLPKSMKMDIGEGNYNIIIQNLFPINNKKKIQTVKNVIQNLFITMIIECLLNVDLDPHLGVINRFHNYGLVLDFCYILQPEIDMQTIQFFNSKNSLSKLIGKNIYGHYFISDFGMRELVNRFENRQDVLTDMINNIIDEIFILIREISI